MAFLAVACKAKIVQVSAAAKAAEDEALLCMCITSGLAALNAKTAGNYINVILPKFQMPVGDLPLQLAQELEAASQAE